MRMERRDAGDTLKRGHQTFGVHPLGCPGEWDAHGAKGRRGHAKAWTPNVRCPPFRMSERMGCAWSEGTPGHAKAWTPNVRCPPFRVSERMGCAWSEGTPGHAKAWTPN